MFSISPILVSFIFLPIIHGNCQGIKWGPCDLDTELPVQCAKLPVPLDYTDESSNTTIHLDLIKSPAQIQPSKGSILLNFGGPGQDGLHSMLDYAPIMGPMTGGYHDLISFDPRGTGKTLRFSCFTNDTASTVAQSSLRQSAAWSSDTAAGRLWAEGSITSDACYSTLNMTGDLVGMSFVARDMMQIVDALGEDGMLRYWGISAGTVLGATVAALFPDKMDKVLLDGVVNSHQYYNSFEPEMLASSDATLEAFLSACAGAPDKCPLAHGNRTHTELENTMSDLLKTIKYNPIPFAGFVIDYTVVESFLFNSLYTPRSWQNLSIGLESLIQGDILTFIEIATAKIGGLPSQDQAIMGIRCGDKSTRLTKLSELDSTFDQYRNTSKWFGDWGWGPYVMTCAQWKFDAKERYEGDFQVQTKNPVFFIGNTFDPVTPLVSAHNMSTGFEGSVVLQHNGHGHTSIAQPSNCTAEAIQNYFVAGVLPNAGTLCEPNKQLFE